MKYKSLSTFDFRVEGYRVQLTQMVNEKGKIIGRGTFSRTHLQEWSERVKLAKRIKTDGMCLSCGEIDFAVLQQHHPDPVKLPTFTITLCANCHARLHFLTGGTKAISR